MASEAPRQPGRREFTRRYTPHRKVCAFCAKRPATIDYKDVDTMYRFVSILGKIEPRRKTGVCAKHQRRLAEAIKRGRHLALLPSAPSHLMRGGLVAPS